MREVYLNIDMIKTGQKIKECIQKTGYTVKDLQKILKLSCPQSIYRWFKGQILPSVDHLYTLSRILGVHCSKKRHSNKGKTFRRRTDTFIL